MNRSHRMLPVAVMVIPFLMGALWTGQALAIDNDVDDEVITVPYDPRPVPSAKQAHHSLRWRHVPAHSILLKELKTGTTLYQFESEKRLSPASLTKIMSALVILEYGHLDDEVTVSPKAARAHKTHLRLRTGQIFRLEDLLKAMLIVSANDACLAASEHVGGDEARFVDLMNAKAAALELHNTHFSNACGFDAPEHYSTAEDLAKLSEIALHHPVFKELVREEREIIMPINEHRAYVLRTTNRLLGRIPGVQGVKTGFTSKAGRCLIAKVSQDGSDLLLVILNSKRRWNTATSLINYGLRLSDSRAALAR
ncbi:MAG TPA: D-alanyl-D-alanine carboxypeptidase family protein [Nitrospira sp.]|nr:D-alanyl-D-alanine carboxypeptidase [Nitrospira sp.]HMU30019.1 D-alanyl-D-alanine carboxypeptidase family protein [Nitrospira sp.]HMV58383.1 D-alanyl-D-alanine carboxypeptidase family protein [Nitrospira sp.]HMW87153.1 D-alanyl-D-alanine carboxypeptidase family protein [Nitrospira sp.]HMX92587.1 D-alanyl-D-alanine carboxypeptidase family protein [Nitrospira sp.]